jgi:hypothetical protein
LSQGKDVPVALLFTRLSKSDTEKCQDFRGRNEDMHLWMFHIILREIKTTLTCHQAKEREREREVIYIYIYIDIYTGGPPVTLIE